MRPLICIPAQSNLLEEARTFRDASIVDVKSYEELKAAVAEGG